MKAPKLFSINCVLLETPWLIVSNASSMVPALPFIASTLVANVEANCPVSGPMARSDSALPNSLP